MADSRTVPQKRHSNQRCLRSAGRSAQHMKPVLFDASVYITSLRRGNDPVMQTRNLEHGSPLWLSAVVLGELYAGVDAAGRKKLARFERDFDKVGRLLVPALSSTLSIYAA